MSPLQIRIGAGALALLALLTLRRQRWAYFAFILLGLAYFPAQAHFHIQLHLPKCEQLISKSIALASLQNYMYIALFAGFYWMSWVQFRRTDARVLWAMLATLLVAALLEVAEGMSVPGVARVARGAARAAAAAGGGPCRVRDLVPDAAGALGAALLLALWSRLTRKPGYVRLVKKGQAVSPSKSSAPPRTAVPRAGVAPPPPPPPQPLYGLPTIPTDRLPPPPPDFSPTPPPTVPAEPTEEVAPVRERLTKEAIIQRLRGMWRPDRLRAIRLGAIWQRVIAMLQRLGGLIRRRRRAIVIGAVVLILVGAAGFVLLQVLPGPAATTVAEQPQAPPPPPPPPRPLQSEAQGYYEPGYNFTVADRRFTRLTLRPDAFLTFARPGAREEAGCADARIGRDAVYLRCELYRVGMVTIDGRFSSRVVTGRLDAPALNAVITVTNPRGEVLYRARDSFRWHGPD